MRKSTLFISAVLTTFVIAVLAGVVSAYQKMSGTDPIAANTVSNSESQVIANSDSIPTPTEVQPVVSWTAQEAAALAAQVLGHDDLYSVEVTELNGESVYMVTFSSGDLVYVSLDGQIRSIGKVEVKTVVVSSGGDRDNGNNNQPRRSSGKDHDEHEEHEEHDDD